MNQIDMKNRRKKAMNKIHKAINEHGGTTLISTGITGNECRLAKAVVDIGVKLLEVNHPSVALSEGYRGVTTMKEAEKIRHEISLEKMANIVKGLRNVVGNDVFITVGAPGTFNESVCTPFLDENASILSRAGADGLHVHKLTLNEIQDITTVAHKNGLVVDAYIASTPKGGIPASTLEDVEKVAKSMEEVGVDVIGLMTGESYGGNRTKKFSSSIYDRLKVLIDTVNTPTIAEGGINLHNYQEFREAGVDIIVIGTALDNIAKEAVAKAAKKFIGN
jgi:thiamine monophosphate synthase